MSHVYLDISRGDRKEHERHERGYRLAQDAMDALSPIYGWDRNHPEQLDDEQRQILQEMWEHRQRNEDKEGADRGVQMRFDPPPPYVVGRIVIETRDDVAPKASENFRSLVTGDKGKGKTTGKPLHYRGCRFFRIEKGFVCQTGDFVNNDGTGGESIYGGKFNDEKAAFKLKHSRAGVVGMANSGKNSNTSQFYITFGACPKLDGKHVVFGLVVEGLDVVELMEATGASGDGTPREVFHVEDCGIL